MSAQNLTSLPRDLTAGLVVFLVALPLCLGIALASAPSDENPAFRVPLFAGLIAGIIGGLVVGALSGSQTSVAGPAAGLTAVVAAQILLLGSFQAFLVALVLAGVIQVVLGVLKAGFLADFVPSSVIKGLLAAIGLILILKQTPHVFGYDDEPQGAYTFHQPDHDNAFMHLFRIIDHIHPGATAIGLLSVVLLIGWDRVRFLKKSPLPSALVAVFLGVGLSFLFRGWGGRWVIEPNHFVSVPAADSFDMFMSFFVFPDFGALMNPKVYLAAFTVAAVASLETLLNLQAVDKIDPLQRTSPPSRELWAQGVGNVLCGFIGGLPVTSVIIRSSVNINAGGRTKLSAIFHGVLLLGCVALLPACLNMIPLSCLAAILLVTGFKLASPKLVKELWKEGKYQFAPFALTVSAIVLTDLLVGVVIGLVVALSFILWSNVKRPIRTIIEKHLGGDVVKIELAQQVSFLNRAALHRVLDSVPEGGHILLDASATHYIDPDILDLIRDFRNEKAPARNIEVSLLGFRESYELHDQIQYVDYSTRDLQTSLTPSQVLEILKNGHERFRTGQQLTRDLSRQVRATAGGEHPLAVVLSCVDSRTPTELIFDVGVGEIFSVRVAGTVISRKVLGSMEYGVLAGAKLIVVMGHTRCGAVEAAIDDVCGQTPVSTGNLRMIVDELRKSFGSADFAEIKADAAKQAMMDDVSRRNVMRVVNLIETESPTLANLMKSGKIGVVGVHYDVVTGDLEFLTTSNVPSTISMKHRCPVSI